MTSATREQRQSQMERMAANVQAHHRRPADGSADLYPNPFPDAVMRGLGGSALAGGLLGLIFGWLLGSDRLVIDSWEQLYSVGSFSLITLWAIFGIALGIMTGGVAAILLAPAQPDTAAGETARSDAEEAPGQAPAGKASSEAGSQRQ